METKELAVYLQRLEWIEAALLDLAGRLSRQQLQAQPAKGRPIQRILEHVVGAHNAYLQSPVTRPQGLSAALRAVSEGPDMPAAMAGFWELANARVAAITNEERTQQVQHGQVLWTARRTMRRLLEHAWEHLLEIRRRLE